MTYGAPGHSDPRWNDHTGQPQMVIAYLIGTLGVGIVIALGMMLASAGYLDGVRSQLRRVEASLPAVLQTRADDAFHGVINKVGNIEHSTATLWDRAREGPRKAADGRKD